MVSYGCVRGRIHRNVQKAYEPPRSEPSLPEPPRPRLNSRYRKVIVGGTLIFDSGAEAARFLGCPDKTLHSALYRGARCHGVEVEYA